MFFTYVATSPTKMQTDKPMPVKNITYIGNGSDRNKKKDINTLIVLPVYFCVWFHSLG